MPSSSTGPSPTTRSRPYTTSVERPIGVRATSTTAGGRRWRGPRGPEERRCRRPRHSSLLAAEAVGSRLPPVPRPDAISSRPYDGRRLHTTAGSALVGCPIHARGRARTAAPGGGRGRDAAAPSPVVAVSIGADGRPADLGRRRGASSRARRPRGRGSMAIESVRLAVLSEDPPGGRVYVRPTVRPPTRAPTPSGRPPPGGGLRDRRRRPSRLRSVPPLRPRVLAGDAGAKVRARMPAAGSPAPRPRRRGWPT